MKPAGGSRGQYRPGSVLGRPWRPQWGILGLIPAGRPAANAIFGVCKLAKAPRLPNTPAADFSARLLIPAAGCDNGEAVFP